MSIEIGKASYGETKKNYFKFKDGVDQLIVRILPPLGNLAKTGQWFKFYPVEFGYKGTDGRQKPFVSPRVVNSKTKMVEVESEAHAFRQSLFDQHQELGKQLDEAVSSENSDLVQELEQKRKDVGAKLKQFNVSKKFFMNAVDLRGNIGLLSIGSDAFTALRKAIDDLRKDGVDPLSADDGRFFVISREKGQSFRDTKYYVSTYLRKVEALVDGQKTVVPTPVKHQLTPELIEQLKNQAFDLDTLYTRVTPEQEKQIVHGGPEGVDKVFASLRSTTFTASSSQSTDVNATTSNGEATVSQQSLEEPLANTSGYVNNDTTSSTEQLSDLAQQSLKEGESDDSPSSSESTDNPDSTEELADMSDEEFLKMMAKGGA